MTSADNRIKTEVAATFGLLTECCWCADFHESVMERATKLALDCQVCEFLKFYCVNVEKNKMF